MVAKRVRVINRWFEASEAARGLEKLGRLLDANVSIIDPEKAASEFEQAMAGARTPREKQAALEAHFAREREKDIPMVEDLPLTPEEETADFKLTTMLRLRTVRAHEHWRGNTNLTFAAIIERLVGQGISTLETARVFVPGSDGGSTAQREAD